MNSDDLAHISAELGQYTSRGVFAGMSESARRGGRTRFVFKWLLDQEFVLDVVSDNNQLMCVDVLPHIVNRSFLDQAVRAYIKSRSQPDLPEHRRIDLSKVSIAYRNRKGSGTLIMQVAEGETAYALKAMLRLMNDLFSWLHLYHIDYLHQHFGVPQE